MPNPSADYPVALHTNTDVSGYGSTALGSSAVTHTALEGKQEEELVAVQTKLGTGSSTPTASTVMRGTGIGTSAWGSVTVADLGSNADTDGTLAANSDAKLPTQKAVKTYVDAAVTGLLDFKGSTDCSSNPNYPVGIKGDAYVVSVAGKIGGASGKSVDIGDVYLATADNAGGTEASVGTSWSVLEHNLTGVYVAGGTDVAIADGGTGQSTAAAGFNALSPLTTQGDILYGGASGAGTRLGIGSALQVLRTNAGATAPEWATASSGGDNTYDAVVAASGGDYTTLDAAIAAASANWRILVLDSNTLGGAITSSLAGLEIVVAGKGTTITQNANSITLSGANVRIVGGNWLQTTGAIVLSGTMGTISDFVITSASNGSNNITLSGTGSSAMDGELKLTLGSAASVPYCLMSGQFSSVTRTKFTMTRLDNAGTTQSTVRATADNISFVGNKIESGTNVANSTFFSTSSGAGGFAQFCNNSAYNLTAVIATLCDMRNSWSTVANNTGFWSASPFNLQADDINCSNNTFTLQAAANCVGITLASGTDRCNIKGNNMTGSGATTSIGIYIVSGNENIIEGNFLHNFTTCVAVDAGARGAIFNNTFATFTTQIIDAGASYSAYGNSPVDINMDKRYVRMKNTSGSTFAIGNVVTLKAVAAGDEVTLTTAASDNAVFGMAVEANADAAYGMVQTRGKTTKLKVDGTTDIAIGDPLTTFTTGGIARKATIGTLGATPGDLAFAIANEAYTANDSNGVIDALLIEPRRF